MAAPTPTSALDMDNPEEDTLEAFHGLTEAAKAQHGQLASMCFCPNGMVPNLTDPNSFFHPPARIDPENIPVVVNVDDAAVLKEAETAAPGTCRIYI